MSPALAELKVGALTLTPTFDDEVFEYTATTSNNTNTVTATAADDRAEVVITANEEEIESGDSVTWETGENTVEVTVTIYGKSQTYTVTVTKTSEVSG